MIKITGQAADRAQISIEGDEYGVVGLNFNQLYAADFSANISAAKARDLQRYGKQIAFVFNDEASKYAMASKFAGAFNESSPPGWLVLLSPAHFEPVMEAIGWDQETRAEVNRLSYETQIVKDPGFQFT